MWKREAEYTSHTEWTKIRASGFLHLSRKYHYLGRKKYCGHQAKNRSSQESIHDEKATTVLKEDRTADEETISKNIRMERGTLWIRSMENRKNRPEKTRGLRDLVLEEDTEDQMDG
jgi:hypothetical protein